MVSATGKSLNNVTVRRKTMIRVVALSFRIALTLAVLAGNLLMAVGSAGAQDDKVLPATLPKLGEKFLPQDVDLARPVYKTSFESPEVLKGWRLEGGKQMSISDGCLV